MRRPTLRGLAGAAIAAGAFAAAVALPASLGEHPRRAIHSTAPEPGPEGLVDRLDAQLEERLVPLDEDARRILTRTIVAEAVSARVDPLLVLAVIEVESAWDPEALSGRGAKGLMQLREPTMRRELARHGLALDDPHDPIANVRAGVRYLRRLLDAFGREEVALMAYNAGPNRILGYLREGAIPERFQAYPRRVRTELGRLRRSMAEDRAPMMARFDRAAPTPAAE